MLDLYFGLDASGFEKSSRPSSCTCTATRVIDSFSPHSQVPQVSGSDYDGHVRVPQQHITLDWCVGVVSVLKIITDTRTVLVSVSARISALCSLSVAISLPFTFRYYQTRLRQSMRMPLPRYFYKLPICPQLPITDDYLGHVPESRFYHRGVGEKDCERIVAKRIHTVSRRISCSPTNRLLICWHCALCSRRVESCPPAGSTRLVFRAYSFK